MNTFINPPSVSGTLGVNNDNFTPLDANTLSKVVKILSQQPKKLTSGALVVGQMKWSADEIALLKERYALQNVYIPELRKPDNPALIGLFSGKFTADQIKTEAEKLGFII